MQCTNVGMFWKQLEKMWKGIVGICFPLSELLFGIHNETFDEIIDALNYCLSSFIFINQKKSESKVFFFECVSI